MEFWLDSIDLTSLEEIKTCGVLHGVTTNPAILAKAKVPVEDVLSALLSSQEGPVAAQVTLVNKMVEQAEELYGFSPRIIIKIPATQEGLKAIHTLSRKGIPTMATAIFEPLQALLAAKAGACYLAPYFRHIGDKKLEVIADLQNLLERYQLPSKILVAALATKEDVLAVSKLGVASVTLKESVFKQCLEAPLKTHDFLKKFDEEWRNRTIKD